MKTCFRLAAIALTCAAVSTLQRPSAQEPAKPRRIALLIGVNNYEGSGLLSLNHATHDMEALREQLKNGGFEERDIQVMNNLDATKEKIESALAQRVKKRGVGDLMLVAMSGHGMQTRNAKGEEDAFFCPYGCDKSEADTLVSLTDVVQKLGGKGANLLLVDACRNDPKRGGRGIQGDELKDRMPVNTAVLFSCSAGQFSFETTQMNGPNAKQGHGVFFYHVLKGLTGDAANRDGEVTWNRLVDYVQQNVNRQAKEWFTDDAKERAKGLGVPLERLRFQSPHQLTNLNESLVLANAAPAAAKPEPRPAPMVAESGDKYKEFDLGDGVKLKLVHIPAGKFWMGSPKGEAERNPFEKDFDAEAQHEVEITKAFYLDVFTVTQEQYMAIMDKTPSQFTKEKGGGPDHPVEKVSWDDAKAFCKKLSEKTGAKFRLPTEAEWEYACRGGETGADTKPFHFKSGPTSSLDATMANFDGNYPYGGGAKGVYREKTMPVGQFEPNRFGLYDMHGNVWQWCEDYYGPYGKVSATKDPIQSDKQESERRVLRGGSWNGYGLDCRAASRFRDAPDGRDYNIGFRVCLPLD